VALFYALSPLCRFAQQDRGGIMVDDRKSGSLSEAGRRRRRFLGQTALMAGTTAAAAALPGVSCAAGATADRAAEAASIAKGPPLKCGNGAPPPMKDVEGKVAFITGGDSGIGLGIARAFADAGMKVVITYRTKSHLDSALKYLEGAGDRVHSIGVDVTDRAAMEAAAEETVKHFGKVHCIVNNAGVGVGMPLSEATYDDFDWGLSVNVTGVFNGVRAFLPRIKAHGEGGQVVATASMSGLFIGSTAGVYSTTKFAVVGMMEALRQELLDTPIGVSVYPAGGVNTDIRESNRNRPQKYSDTSGQTVTADPKRLAAIQELVRRNGGQPPGMDPLEAGRGVLRGVRNNDLYIITHPEYEQGIIDRHEAIIASIPRDAPPVPPLRAKYEERVLRASVYYMERDRKRCAMHRGPYDPKGSGRRG
jgi:NAD(P)-dependent dehydrogenase (short-subunit alcohol dehydrogenase family)